MSLPLIVGIGVVVAFLLLLAFILDDDEESVFRNAIKTLLILFALTLIVLVPKATLDNNTVCDVVVQNSSVAGNNTTYTYTDYCYVRSENTSEVFFNAYATFLWLFWSGLGVWIIYKLAIWIKDFRGF